MTSSYYWYENFSCFLAGLSFFFFQEDFFLWENESYPHAAMHFFPFFYWLYNHTFNVLIKNLDGIECFLVKDFKLLMKLFLEEPHA